MKTRSKLMFNIFTLVALLISLLGGAVIVQPVQAELLAAPFYASGDFLWAKSMGQPNDDLGNAIALDSSGNVYTTGWFAGTVDFDPGVGTADLTVAGLADVFVSKLDSSGNFVWAKSMGGAGSEGGASITVDSSGNVYTTGSYEGLSDFDPGSGTANLGSLGRSDIFISKLNSDGSFIWAKSMGGASIDGSSSITVDSNGNIYTTGIFSTGGFVLNADFDPGPGTAYLSSMGWSDIFISKLDGNGSFIWAKSIGGADYDYANGISVDSSGNVYTTGTFQNTVDFNPGSGLADLTTAGWNDIFVSKLDGSGNYVWAKSMGGTGDDLGNAIALDSSDNVYTTGYFQVTSDFDPGPGAAELTSAGEDDIFVSKLDGNGNFNWAKKMGGDSDDRGNAIALDANNNIYTTGSFQWTADFDPGAGVVNLTTTVGTEGLSHYDDIFISKLDGNGNFNWAKSIGGKDFDYGRDIAADASGNVYTTGTFSAVADFDPGPGVFNLIGAGPYGDYSFANTDIFVSKLSDNAIFTDVPYIYWANSYIERLNKAGITGGCVLTPLQYCPDSTVTRAQMAVFLLKGMHGSSFTPPVVGTSTGFGDVATNYWAAAWIKQLAAEGITSGCGGGNYCPDAIVTRAQMAIFLLKAKHGSSYSPPNASGVFIDVPVDYWADKWIEQLAVEGVTSGCGNNNYCPDDSVTRAQMAVFLVKAFNLP